MSARILVVDDEERIVDIVRAYLERDGYKVSAAYDGSSALEVARRDHPDLIILDLMLPEISGWEVCRILRKESDLPIIMLTARDETSDKIAGLELGADDYIVKPFDPKELVVRVRAVLRRYQTAAQPPTLLRSGNLSMEIERRSVQLGNRDIELTATEFELLRALMESPGRVFSRMQLLDRVQGEAYEGYERTIDSHVKNLRKKIEPDPEHPRFIVTVYGVGYKLGEGKDA